VETVTRIELPFVDPQRGRDGAVKYWYFRRGGRRWRLPGAPFSPEFMAKYHELVAATEPGQGAENSTAHAPGSVDAVVIEYLGSAKFKEKSPGTKRQYRLHFEKVTKRYGKGLIKNLTRQHVMRWQDTLSDTPGTANMVVKVLRLLCKFAIDRGYLRENPVRGIELQKLGEHRAWTDEECATFEARWPAGSMQRRAYMLAKYTGQRCGDIAAMTRAHRKVIRAVDQTGAELWLPAIRVVQQKTGTELWVPEHRALTAELALGGGHMSLLTKHDGSAFGSDALRLWFADAIEEAGLPDQCVLHGLRKTAARMLAEAGCTTHQIAAITGHRGLKQIEDYTRAARQLPMATAAIHQLQEWEQNRNRTATAKPPSRRLPNKSPRA
jgi:integrase